MVFTILSILLWTNDNFDTANLSITSAAIWINPFVGILTIISLWPVAMMFNQTRGLLSSKKIIPKFVLYQLSITSAAIWINPFVGILTIISLWPVAMMFNQTRGLLSSKKIIPKFVLYQLVLILSQLQSAIINILAMGGNIACAPPFSSQARGSFMNQQLLIMEMFIVTLVSRIFYRRRYEELDAGDEHEEDNKDNAKTQLKEDGAQWA
ncbi:UNVERIFIED_CONTAM: hypothetical protein FKN15_054844 [Acipenser sinensis]